MSFMFSVVESHYRITLDFISYSYQTQAQSFSIKHSQASWTAGMWQTTAASTPPPSYLLSLAVLAQQFQLIELLANCQVKSVLIVCSTAARANSSIQLVAHQIFLLGDMEAGDCKDKRRHVGGSGNAFPCTDGTHIQLTHRHAYSLFFSVLPLLQNLCPGELRDHCAVLLLSHCLVLAMQVISALQRYLIPSAVQSILLTELQIASDQKLPH